MDTNRLARIAPLLTLRARLMAAVRGYFDNAGFLEVETPARIPAPAPEAHIDAVPSGEWFMRASPELCMKRMLAAGYSRIYQICRCFRGGERGARHLPEFTLLEWYEANTDYRDMMARCEEMIRSVAAALGHGAAVTWGGRTVRLDGPWERLSVAEAFDRHAPLPMAKALAEDRFDHCVGLDIEPRLGLDRPTFLYDYPAEAAALAARRPDRPALAQRFELYIAGMELCNAFTELIDPAEQRDRFEKEEALRRAAGKPPYPSPERFLRDLALMPPAAGNALGLDRLAMLLAGADRIDDVVAFAPEDL